LLLLTGYSAPYLEHCYGSLEFPRMFLYIVK